jgi:hypothetical protein
VADDDDARLRRIAQMAVPVALKDPRVLVQRMKHGDRSNHAVVCLSSDKYEDVFNEARRYPGWVLIVMYAPSPPGVPHINIRLHDVYLRRGDDVPPLDPGITIGEVLEIVAEAEASGEDLWASDNVVSQTISRQHALIV